ncbi:MAG TPA: hypothetical protein VNJ52_04960 [Patescibacteria group bacterium]|nr:hypothetical protein [Patescibacteria group bacterium]
MASVKLAYESTQTPTITLASLANGATRACTAIDNSSALDLDAVVFLQIKTGGTGVSSTGHVDVYIVKSLDGTNWDDGFSGTDSGLSPVVGSTFLFSFPAYVNASSFLASERLSKVFDRLPKKFSICVVNNTGAAFDSTAANFKLIVAPDYLTVA